MITIIRRERIGTMPNYIIATSSTSDLTRDYLEKHSIPFISYSYTIGDKIAARNRALPYIRACATTEICSRPP